MGVTKDLVYKSVSIFTHGIGSKLVWSIANDDTLIGLANIFSRLKYMERRGYGFMKIMSAYNVGRLLVDFNEV